MNGHHQVAIWAGVSAFFGSLLTIEAVDILNPTDALRLAGSVVVALVTAGGVYAKQRLDDAKETKTNPPSKEQQ